MWNKTTKTSNKAEVICCDAELTLPPVPVGLPLMSTPLGSGAPDFSDPALPLYVASLLLPGDEYAGVVADSYAEALSPATLPEADGATYAEDDASTGAAVEGNQLPSRMKVLGGIVMMGPSRTIGLVVGGRRMPSNTGGLMVTTSGLVVVAGKIMPSSRIGGFVVAGGATVKIGVKIGPMVTTGLVVRTGGLMVNTGGNDIESTMVRVMR